MNGIKINLRSEQEITLKRARRHYGIFAKMLFWNINLIYGKGFSLPKVKFLEILARIPYQSWEICQYGKLHSKYGDCGAVKRACCLIEWGRAAQDNEFWHLRVITERMQHLNIRETFLQRMVTPIAVVKYTIFSRLLALINIKSAFLLNADFEDHAEHEYMQYVRDHPELEKEMVAGAAVKEYSNFTNWADVFRQIALDEREHMNNSLAFINTAK